jgi:hypothetical protein
MKSPISMKNGRFYTSKCRGKLQNMGGVVHPFSFPKLPKKNSKKKG